MSVEAVDAAIHTYTVGGTTKLVLVVLAEAASKHEGFGHHVCWLAQRTIAKRSGVSDRQIRRILEDLETQGLIGRHSKNPFWTGRPDRATAVYEMTFMKASGRTITAGRRLPPIQKTSIQKNTTTGRKRGKPSGTRDSSSRSLSTSVGRTSTSSQGSDKDQALRRFLARRVKTADLGGLRDAKSWREHPRFDPVRPSPAFPRMGTEAEADQFLRNCLFVDERHRNEEVAG